MGRQRGRTTEQTGHQGSEKLSKGRAPRKVNVEPNLERRLKIFALLEEISQLLVNEKEIDATALEYLSQLQLRLSLRTSYKSDKNLDDPLNSAPRKWLDRENRNESPVGFILREYKTWIGKISRAKIKDLDKSLYSALYRYISKGGEIPPEFDVPTQKEINTRLLERAGYLSGRISNDQREAVRLYHVAMRRPFPGKKRLE